LIEIVVGQSGFNGARHDGFQAGHFNTTTQMLHAVLGGFGLAYVPEGIILPYFAKRQLRRVLGDW
jgi:hypothetical protein